MSLSKQTFDINGLRMYKNFIPKKMTTKLYNYINSQGFDKALKRDVKHYGYIYDYNIREPQRVILKKGPEPPPVLVCLATLLYRSGMMRNLPNQILINKYKPGEGISAHRDHRPIFDNDIATLSLGSTYVMDFQHHKSYENYDKSIKESIPLDVGSILIFGDDARDKWTHAIANRKSDTVNGNRTHRGDRISITFRTVLPEYRGIDILQQSSNEFMAFKGVPLNEIIGLFYILENNRGICAPIAPIIRKFLPNESFDVGDYSISWQCLYNNPTGGNCERLLIQPRKFDENLNRCLYESKSRFIIIPIGMNAAGGRMGGGAHSNYLILDKRDNSAEYPNGTVERYEPHGSGIYYNDWYSIYELDKQLAILFEVFGVRYIAPLDYCPFMGLQTIEGREKHPKVMGETRGYCSAWSQYWASLRLRNPDVPRERLEVTAINTINTNFREFIRNYAGFLIENKRKILQDLPKDTIILTQYGEEINPKRQEELRYFINKKIEKLLK